jgi:hypothetical protein
MQASFYIFLWTGDDRLMKKSKYMNTFYLSQWDKQMSYHRITKLHKTHKFCFSPFLCSSPAMKEKIQPYMQKVMEIKYGFLS